MSHPIDLDALREILEGQESMVAYYGKSADAAAKLDAQNTALIAAGLGPIEHEFNEWRLSYNAQMAACYRKQAEVLRHVIAYHSGEIYVPGEVVDLPARQAVAS